MRRQPAGDDDVKAAVPAPFGARSQQPPSGAAMRLPGSVPNLERGPRLRGRRMAMAVPGHLTGLARRPGLPRRTVRLRLTALYGALFLLSGTGLLAITNALARAWPWPRPQEAPLPAALRGPGHRGTLSPERLNAINHQLQAQAAHQHAAALNQLLAASAVALAVMAVVSVALGWVVAGRVLRPLREMTAATRAISADDLGDRLAVPGPGDELKDLGDTIDGLLERLEGAFTAQRRLSPTPPTSCAPRWR
jgi:HAMP domain-containing protein